MPTFAWTEIPEEPMTPLISRRVLHTAQITLAEIRLAKGAILPLHHHVSDQITMVVSGRLLFRMGGEEIIVEAGRILPIPSNLPHLVEALEDSIATDVFAPPRFDWQSGDDSYLRQGV